MAFISLSNLAAKTGRIIQSQCVTATQTKKSTGAVELGFRLSKSAMDETGITIGIVSTFFTTKKKTSG